MIEHNELYMYPLHIPIEAGRALCRSWRSKRNVRDAAAVLQLGDQQLHQRAGQCGEPGQPGAIPPNIALLFPGYANDLLYDHGFIPNDISLDALSQKYYISDLVRKL